MYYLMNKDNVVLEFQSNLKPSDVVFSSGKQEGQTPYGFQNITAWIERRKASKHNKYLETIMKQLGCDDNEGFIRLTHAVGINDTFWIKNDKENTTWKEVSLYQNQFSEVISRLAFEGAGLYGETFSFISPELSCEGSFRKCFRKERTTGEFDSDIFLYKRGGEVGAGIEPYCEVLASEIAKIVAPSLASVKYDLCELHGKLASKCNIFTNEKIGYASFSKMNNSKFYTFEDVENFFERIGGEQSFRELLTVDSLCFNQDRHSGNYGVLFDNDTLKIIGMSPIFDLNLSMLPYVKLPEFENIGDILFEYSPKLGNDFTRIGQIAMNDIIRDRLKNIADFSFSFRGDDKFSGERIKCLEEIVRKQAAAILSNEKLQTKDVFFSQKAMLAEERMERSAEAAVLMNEFNKCIEKLSFSSDSFISVCSDIGAVQLYFENSSYMLIVDFLEKKVSVQQNAQEISMSKLKKDAPDFYNDVQAISTELAKFLQKKNEAAFLMPDDKSEKEVFNFTEQEKIDLVYEMMIDTGFSIKYTESSGFCIYDNESKSIYANDIEKVDDVISELRSFMIDNLLNLLSEEANTAKICVAPLSLEEWRGAIERSDMQKFINSHYNEYSKVQLLLAKQTDDTPIDKLADKFQWKDITDGTL